LFLNISENSFLSIGGIFVLLLERVEIQGTKGRTNGLKGAGGMKDQRKINGRKRKIREI
jgi:hypothetical protein